MISGEDIYILLVAIVPLYMAMILAYASVRWWRIFTPEQCSGINRFVAVFAIPLLSFNFIAFSDLYSMKYRFIADNSLQKITILVAFFLWNAFTKHGSLEWMITIFSLSTMPNTFVVGISMLKSMYGDFSASLIVQIIVLQAVIWSTVILFMFEYIAAKLLIAEQFPTTAKSVSSFRVDSNAVSLGGIEPSEADSENKSRSNSMTPRASSLAGVDIYSLQSSGEPTLRHGFNQAHFSPMFPKKVPRNNFQNNGYGSDAFLRQSSKGATERMSNFEEEMKKRGGRSISDDLFNGGLNNSSHAPPNAAVLSGSNKGGAWKKDGGGNACKKEIQMYVWSPNRSIDSEGNRRHEVNRGAFAEHVSIDLSEFVAGETAVSKGTAKSQHK